jgi:hypothetical protein
MTATAVRRPPPLPPDRDLPGGADLLAEEGERRVARFLDERGLEPQRVEAAQAHYRPGRWLAVCFRTAAVERASAQPVSPTVTVECRAGAADALWAFPDDPSLPGLAVAVDGGRLRRRLRPHPADLVVEPLRYRPRRRAVLRYRLGGDRVLFGKVVPPRRADRLLALAGGLRSPGGEAPVGLALPVGRVAPGVLVLPPLSGRPLRDLLLGGGRLPGPERLAALPAELDRWCAPALTGPAAAGRDHTGGLPAATRRRLDAGTALCAARTVARLLPDAGGTAARVAEAVINWGEDSDPPDDRIVHGDLYENQVFVDGDRLGLVDLDDVGPGDPLLDAANFTAHLLLRGTSGPPAGGLILRYREELRAAFCHRFDADPAQLAWREADCLLRLVSGPFRVLHPDWPRRMAARLTLAADALAVRR